MRHVLVVVAVVVLAGAAHAQGNAQGKGVWLADPKTGCKSFDSDPSPGESMVWTGPCVNGVVEGRGKLDVFVKGKLAAHYEGDMKGGRATGQGTLRFPDGEVYQGGFLDGKRHGHGIDTWAGGERFEGEHVNDERDGPGVYTWPNGRRFAGQYRKDKPNGPGTYTNENGTFSGNWINGCLNDGTHRAYVNTTKEACGFK